MMKWIKAHPEFWLTIPFVGIAALIVWPWAVAFACAAVLIVVMDEVFHFPGWLQSILANLLLLTIVGVISYYFKYGPY